jgi:muramoyltetrapeptide carboxypeptidase LdcA involved in peptidoglycan recycling
MERFAGDRETEVKDLRSMMDNGWFEHVSGFVFGRPMFYDGDDYEDAVRSVLSDLHVPIVFDADVGHKAPRMTLINGARMKVHVKDGKGRISYPGFTEEY